MSLVDQLCWSPQTEFLGRDRRDHQVVSTVEGLFDPEHYFLGLQQQGVVTRLLPHSSGIVSKPFPNSPDKVQPAENDVLTLTQINITKSQRSFDKIAQKITLT